MGKFQDTVSSWADEDGVTTVPEDGLTLLSAAYDDDVAEASSTADAAARADIQAIVTGAVDAAIAAYKAAAFDEIIDTPTDADNDDTDSTDSGANGSENDEEADIDDLFRS